WSPTVPSAAVKASTLPNGTTSPPPRSSSPKATAMRAGSASASATPIHRSSHQLTDAVGANPLLVLPVLEDGAEGDVDGVLVELAAPEGGQRHGPVDR